MATNARNQRSNARRGGQSGWRCPKPSSSRQNRHDGKEGDHQERPNKQQTYVSLISDEEEEGGVVSPSRKRNVSYVDTPYNSPAPKRIASGPVTSSNLSSFPAAGPASPSTDLALRLSLSTPQTRNTVSQLAAQLHQKQDENAQLVEKMDNLRLIAAKKDAEIASLRATIEGMQQTAADNFASNTGPAQQNGSWHPVYQQVGGHQPALDHPIPPCSTCMETNEPKQKLAEVQHSLSKARNTVVHQHDEIKALIEQANSSKTTLIEERATVAQYKLSIDQLALKVAAEQATAKNLQTTLTENQVVINHLNVQFSSQNQELSDARATIMSNESTIADLKDELVNKQMAMEAALSGSKSYIDELNLAIEDFKRQVANGQATLHDARTAIFVNGAVIEDLKKIAGSHGAVPENTAKDKNDLLPGDDNKALKCKLREAEQEIEELRARVNQFDKECEEFRKNYHEDQKTKGGLRDGLKTSWENEDKISAQADFFRQEVEKHQRGLAEYETRYKQQQEKLVECEAKFDQQRQIFDQEKENTIDPAVKAHRQLLSEREPEIEGLRKELQGVNEQLVRIQLERDQAVTEMAEHIASENRQAGQLESIKSALGISQAHVQSLKNQLGVKSVQFASLEENLKIIQTRLVAAENRAREAEARTTAITSQFKRYKDEVGLENALNLNVHLLAIDQLNATISQLQERNQALEAVDQSLFIKTMETRIADVQTRLDSAQGPVNQAAIQAQIAHLQSQVQQKNDEISSANDQLERVFNQYQELSDERAEDKKRNQVLGPQLQTLRAEGDKALHELEETKTELKRAETDVNILENQSVAIYEGGHPEFVHMEIAWEPKLRDARAQLETASKERDESLRQVRDLTAQLQTVSREKDEMLRHLEASRTELAEFQTTVEVLHNQLSRAEGGIDPAIQETLESMRGIQNARDIPRKRGNGVSFMFVNTFLGIFRCVPFFANRLFARRPIFNEKSFPMTIRSGFVLDSYLKTLNKEALHKIVNQLQDEHEKIEDHIRDLITRFRGEMIRAPASEKEVKVWKAIARKKDKSIDQATAQLLGTSNGDAGVANSEDPTMMDIGFDSDFNEFVEKKELENPDVYMKDAGSPRMTLMLTFGPTRRGYKCWKGESVYNFDRLDTNTSHALKTAFLTDKGKKIYYTLRDFDLPCGRGVHCSSPAPTTTTLAPFKDMLLANDETHSLYTAIQETSTLVRPSTPALRSASVSIAPQASLLPVEPDVARRGGAAAQTFPQNDPPNTQDSSQSYTSAVYPALSSGQSRGCGTMGRYTASRFRPSVAPTLAGPSQPRRPSMPTSTPHSWSADQAEEEHTVDMDSLGSGFTMESIEQEPESPRDKGKGKERAAPGLQEDY
ncbi:hypothetical protein QBC36DRAFT_362037, partial [Triangularia setosa]